MSNLSRLMLQIKNPGIHMNFSKNMPRNLQCSKAFFIVPPSNIWLSLHVLLPLKYKNGIFVGVFLRIIFCYFFFLYCAVHIVDSCLFLTYAVINIFRKVFFLKVKKTNLLLLILFMINSFYMTKNTKRKK